MGKVYVRKQPRLQEGLDVELQGADRVLEFVLLKDLRVQDTEVTNDLVLAADAEVDGGGVAREESRVYRNVLVSIF